MRGSDGDNANRMGRWWLDSELTSYTTIFAPEVSRDELRAVVMASHMQNGQGELVFRELLRGQEDLRQRLDALEARP